MSDDEDDESDTLIGKGVRVAATPGFKRTDQECPICEDGEILQDRKIAEKFCDTCLTVLEKDTHREETQGEWESFFEYRKNEYSGFHGDERIKMAGGFAGAYVFEEDF